MEDPYRILGVGPGATAAELRRARNDLARRLHPDAGGASAEGMAAVNAAYAAAVAALAEEAVLSFEVLPVEAFAEVAAAVAGSGEVLDADEPYRLEGYLADPPGPCFVAFELWPEAGGTMVTVTVEGAEGAAAVPSPAEVVRALFSVR